MKLNQIVLRYLKGQKKHTAMSILAIATATVFMTIMLAGVSVYFASAKNICKAENGTYHVLFNGLDKQQLASIRSMDIFSETQFYSVSTYSSNTDVDFGQMADENAEIEYMLVNGMPVDDYFLRINPDSIDMMPPNLYAVSEGRLPEKDGEVVLSTSNAAQWGYPEIGSQVDVELYTCGTKTEQGGITENVPQVLMEKFDVKSIAVESLTVVGYSDSSNIVHYSDTKLRSYSYLSDNLIARFSDDTNDLYWNMHHAFKDAGYEIDDFTYSLNQQLLDYEGKGVTAKFSLALIFAVAYLVILFLMFCVRMVIDNSFELADKERIRQFGLLKTTGASKKQIFAMIIWEALYLAIPGVAAGILIGTVCAGGVFNVVKQLPYLATASSDYDLGAMLEFDIQPYVYISSAVIGIFWVIVSAISTGMRSIKASPVEAIRAAGKKEKIYIPKYSSGLEKGASFISAYSGISIKRNKKRYILTMVSMVMSIVLFAGFSYGVDIADNNLKDKYEINCNPYDYSVSYFSLGTDDVLSREKEMLESGLFSEVQHYSEYTVFGDPQGLKVSENSELSQYTGIILKIVPISKATYEKYITSSVSYDELRNSGKILISSSMYTASGEFSDKIYDSIPSAVSGQPVVTASMDIFDERSFDVLGGYETDNKMYQSASSNIIAVTAAENYSTLLDINGMDAYTTRVELEDGSGYYVYRRTIEATAAQGMEEEAELYLDKHFYDSYTNHRKDMNFSYAVLEIVKVLGYFITSIIAIIAAVNIANIISSNVIGRTSEFAMLRACGMSDKQIHSLILRESMIYSILASIISLLVIEAAMLVIQIPFKTHFHDLTMEDLGITFSYTQPLIYIGIAAAASFIIAAASSFLPARRIIKSSIVDNINSMENR